MAFAQEEPRVNNDSLFLLGRSLGGAVSILLASRHKTAFKGMILENTFSSISDMVD